MSCDLQTKMTTRINSTDTNQHAQDSLSSNAAPALLENGNDRRDDSSAPSSSIAAAFSANGLSRREKQTSVDVDITVTAQSDINCLLPDTETDDGCQADNGDTTEVKNDDSPLGDSSTLYSPEYSPELDTQHEKGCMLNSDSSGIEENSSAVLPSVQKSSSRNSRLCSLCGDDNIPAIAHCSQCDADLCSACVRRHSRMNLAVHHKVVLFVPRHSDNSVSGSITDANHGVSVRNSSLLVADHCHKHLEERLRFFCKTCQWPVCRDCILTTHKQHVTQDIADSMLAAKNEMVDMLAQLAQIKVELGTYHKSFEDYKIQFERQTQRVEEMITTFYNDTKRRIDASYHKLIGDLEECQKTEMERVHSQELTVQNNIQDATKLLDQQALNLDSSIHVLSQREMVSHAIKTLSKNIQQIELGQSEFFISKNPKLATIPEHFLGRITFTTRTIPQAHSDPNLHGQTIIREVKLHRELAFNICEMHSSKSSVQSVVETSSGTVWVATSHSLLKVSSVVRKEHSNAPDTITGLVAGGGDKLLVSLGQGSSIKVYANGSWTPFVSAPKSSMVMASRKEPQNRLRVYVAVTPQTGTTRIVSYSTEGQACQQFKLPAHIPHGTPSAPTSSLESSSAERTSSSSSVKVNCMAVGEGGRLYLGDAGGRRLLIVDREGALTGQYLGPDGHSGCLPCSVCVLGSEQVVLADSERSTVELVSGQGKLLALLLSREHFVGSGGPTCVTVDSKHRLWVGTSRGHVYAFTFLHTYLP